MRILARIIAAGLYLGAIAAFVYGLVTLIGAESNFTSPQLAIGWLLVSLIAGLAAHQVATEAEGY